MGFPLFSHKNQVQTHFVHAIGRRFLFPLALTWIWLPALPAVEMDSPSTNGGDLPTGGGDNMGFYMVMEGAA